MKPEDDEPSPSDDEVREAQALAAALEPDAAARKDGAAAVTPAPGDALETASLLRQTRPPLAVPPAHEPVAAAHVAPALDARRSRGRRRARVWLATSLVAPAAAAAWLLFATTLSRHAAPPAAHLPPRPTADLLAAQAEATRGGGQAGAALAALDSKMRAYRRQYHEDLRRRGGAP
jgi:hypothetical protein